MEAKLKKELKAQVKLLKLYKRQLEARHHAEPLKPPPLFLLNVVTDKLAILSK